MQALTAFLHSPLAGTLFEALLHSLWQALLFGIILYGVLRLRSANRSSTRYLVATGALAGVLVAFLATWTILNRCPVADSENLEVVASSQGNGQTDPASSSPGSDSAAVSSTGEANPMPSASNENPSSEIPWRGTVMVLWFAGVCLMLVRAAWLILGAGRLLRSSKPVADPRILEIVESLREKLHISRRIAVLACDRVVVPGVIGFLRPALLLPLSMLSEIPADDLRAVLAHELAHIRRHDYFLNFCQLILEALFFFNPAVWWISRQIRIEREACCDRTGVSACGEEKRYAEILALWASRLGPESPSMPAAAIVGFTGSDQSGSILDRIKRILVKDHRPRLRVSWPIAIVMLVASIAVLIGLYKGTNATVALAERLLTPQERIEQIEEISQSHGFADREYGPADKILLSGTITTWNGRPLPKDTHIMVRSERPRNGYNAGISLSRDRNFTFDGPFEYEAEFGEIVIVVSADGYAPVFSGPHRAEPGGIVSGIEIVLQEGFDATLKFTDGQGHPVPNARIIGGYLYEEGSYSHTIKLTSDESGLAVLHQAAAHKIALQVRADGFEVDRSLRFVPDPNQPAVFKLKKTLPATGVLISRETGEPVEGAEVRLMISWRENSSYGENGMYGDPEAVTDAQGRFALKSLRSDQQYLVLFKAPGYMPTYSDDITPGCNIEIPVKRFRPIKGKVIGDLSGLSKRDGLPIVSYTDKFSVPSHSSVGSSKNVELDVRDGEAFFTIDDYWGQTLSIYAGDESRSLDPATDDVNNLVFNLSPEVDPEKRCVVLQVNVPQGSPPAGGGIRIDYITEAMRKKHNGMKPEWIELKDGRAEVYVPVPCDFKYSIDYCNGLRPVGYWFPELRKPVRVDPGEEPFVLEIEANPAGAIYGGIVNNSDGDSQSASASLVLAKKPDNVKYAGDLSNVLSNGMSRGKFNASPLPLNGAYVIVAHKADTWVATDPVELTPANPIRECEIRLARGIALEGRLLDADGSPSRMMVCLQVSLKTEETSWGSGGTQVRPDENGRFVFENVNPDFKGDYYIKVATEPGYRPLRHKVEDVKKPVALQLEKGLKITGVVLDNATGYPVPKVDVRAWSDSTSATVANYESLEADGPTDNAGRFTFSNMAKREYRFFVSGGNIAESPGKPLRAVGGQSDLVTIRINIPEWSDLKPVAPKP